MRGKEEDRSGGILMLIATRENRNRQICKRCVCQRCSMKDRRLYSRWILVIHLRHGSQLVSKRQNQRLSLKCLMGRGEVTTLSQTSVTHSSLARLGFGWNHSSYWARVSDLLPRQPHGWVVLSNWWKKCVDGWHLCLSRSWSAAPSWNISATVWIDLVYNEETAQCCREDTSCHV